MPKNCRAISAGIQLNPASGNPTNPNGLAAFTDDDGYLSGLTGLLNDFPTLGSPVKLIQYDLAAPIDIEKIGILSGNLNNADGRIFSTSVIRYSINGGADYSLLGYFESAPLGSINNEQGVPGSTEDHALHLEIFDDASTVMIAGVTNLQFDFYAVDNTQGQYRDPFDGVNPFTEIDDGLTAAISSPLIWEIDAIGQSGSVNSADFDGNQVVDGKDFLIWQRGFGALGTGTPEYWRRQRRSRRQRRRLDGLEKPIRRRPSCGPGAFRTRTRLLGPRPPV